MTFLRVFFCRIIFNEALRFGSRHCFHRQAGKSPNMVDPLHIATLRHWARSKGSTRLGVYLPDAGNTAGFRNVIPY